MIRVETLQDAQLDRYDGFVREQSAAMVYHAPFFWEFLGQAVGGERVCLVARRQDRIVGVLPYFSLHRPELGTVINSLPWYGSHGGCLLLDPDDDEARRALLAQYASAVAEPTVLAATLVLTPEETRRKAVYRGCLPVRFADRRIGQVTPLPEPGDGLDGRLLGVLRQKTRNLVRKALNQGFELVGADEDWAWRFLWQTHTSNIEAIGGRAKPWSHFEALRSRIPPAARRLLIARAGGEPAAALLLLYFGRTVEYLVPTISKELRSRQPLSFLIFHGMLDAVGRGFRWWNWGGTWLSQETLLHFKAGWGAEERPYEYLICATDRMINLARKDLTALGRSFAWYYLIPFGALGDTNEPRSA